MIILVTGGTGLLGQAVKKHITAVDSSVTVVDYSQRHGLDVRNTVALEDCISTVDTVINCAARTRVTQSWNDPISFAEVNYIGAINVQTACLKYKKRLIHISSSEVYGTNQYTDTIMTESHPLMPHYPYAISKAAADLHMQVHQKCGQDIVILRPFNIYGAEYNSENEKIIPKFVHLALTQKDIEIYGDGAQSRDWVFVDDVATAVWLSLGIPAGVYNVCSGVSYSIRAVADMVLGTVSKYIDTTSHTVFRARTNDRMNAIEHLWGSPYKFSCATHGWVVPTSLQQGTIKCILQQYAEVMKEMSNAVSHSTGVRAYAGSCGSYQEDLAFVERHGRSVRS
jgi:nucleoside-diphosphate-sugar epimerase